VVSEHVRPFVYERVHDYRDGEARVEDDLPAVAGEVGVPVPGLDDVLEADLPGGSSWGSPVGESGGGDFDGVERRGLDSCGALRGAGQDEEEE